MTANEYVEKRKKQLDNFSANWSNLQCIDPDAHPNDMNEKDWDEMISAFDVYTCDE